jgi:hypothetical protein
MRTNCVGDAPAARDRIWFPCKPAGNDMGAAHVFVIACTLVSCAVALRLALLPFARRLRDRGCADQLYTDLTVALPLGLAFPVALLLIWFALG